MRRLSLLALCAVCAPLLHWFSWLGPASPAVGAAPLCLLSPESEQVWRDAAPGDVVIGAAVIEIASGAHWTSGADAPFRMHSVIKPPIAAALYQEYEAQDRELGAATELAVYTMVAHSANEDVWWLLESIGGVETLAEYYARWGVADLAEGASERWGSNRSTPLQLARLYAALAVSEEVLPSVRGRVFSLLDDIGEIQRWGAEIPDGALTGWQSLIKTGNYSVPGKWEPSSDGDGQESADRQPTYDTPLGAQVYQGRTLVRMNSAAIWESAPWRGKGPRYVIAIMLEGFIGWGEAEWLQNRLGEAIAQSLVRRAQGQFAIPTAACLKRALA